METDITKLIQKIGNRVFVDIAHTGCGSGCIYCYVETRNDKQVLASEKEIDAVCDWIIKRCDTKCVVSMCPNTEPFKSKKSTNLILHIARRLAPFSMLLQISTKEHIQKDTLETLNSYLYFPGQLCIGVSMPTISKSQTVEPRATMISKRRETIRNIGLYNFISSSLYIKPFMSITEQDIHRYIEIINECSPNHICVGVDFTEHIGNATCSSSYEAELARKYFDFDTTLRMLNFAQKIERETGKTVSFSSVCHLPLEYRDTCGLRLIQYSEKLCKNCITP